MSEGDARSRGERTGKLVARGILRFCVLGIVFLPAGTLRWTRGWIWILLWALTVAVNVTVIRRRNPGLLPKRLKQDKPEKPFDRFFYRAALALTIAMLILAGLDAVRFGWSSVPVRWIYSGIVLHALGDIPVAWAMAANAYLERTVRIQSEEGHAVVTTGPYRFVRHPMYAGIILMYAGTPLILGSLWSFVPIGLILCLLVYRTVREDETLRRELPGYEDYARRTRFRLVPGVW